ncbi:TAXI family TRAP transporter solute-binding subunit [Evansella sp. AB-P1]|uniref:TAXI family TRAP transporter solute-binding subunit n=1 Tax=Evansella sp. AB-P1 TaxID=3037653 RepID=UPI00241C051C|nr:TAXI family TRAP transporter solute-binding subunit [Evansella sp. AB-P1]MDG5789196.1 TAXI family TRAP transporter solute-binding subunit [Evansella sp. AB-P1]
MSKKLYSMFALLLTAILFLAACGDGNNNNNDDVAGNNNNNDNDAADEVNIGNLQLGTGGTGGTYYPLGGEMATVITNNIEGYDGFDLSAVSSGASVDNLVMIRDGEVALGMTVHIPAIDSLTGDGDFHGVPVENFGFMGHIYPEVMQIITPAGSGIETIGDLAGKNVAIGPPGSGTQALAKLILEAYGLEDGDYTAFEENFGDAADRIQDGNLDASFGLLGLPASSIEGLALNRDIRMIPITPEGLAYVEENSGYEGMTIPSDSYSFLDEDIQAITAYAILVGSTDLIDEDLGYAITKALFENRDQISHDQGAHLTKENALLGSEGLPMHPGAERYFQEEGLQ